MPPTVIYTLSLHDALPISAPGGPTPADAAPDPDAAKWASLAAELDKPETEEAAEEPSPPEPPQPEPIEPPADNPSPLDRKSTRLNSSHLGISYAVFCLKKK